MPQLLIRPTIMYLPRDTPEEGPEGLASEGDQRIEGNTTTNHTVLQSRKSSQRNLQSSMQSYSRAHAGPPHERYDKGLHRILFREYVPYATNFT